MSCFREKWGKGISSKGNSISKSNRGPKKLGVLGEVPVIPCAWDNVDMNTVRDT